MATKKYRELILGKCSAEKMELNVDRVIANDVIKVSQKPWYGESLIETEIKRIREGLVKYQVDKLDKAILESLSDTEFDKMFDTMLSERRRREQLAWKKVIENTEAFFFPTGKSGVRNVKA